MRLSNTICACLLIAPCLGQIPNASFETWHDAGNWDDPDDWYNLNGSGTQAAPGTHGSYFVKVTSFSGQWGYEQGEIHTTFPCTSRPGMLVGQWQFHPQGTEVGAVFIWLATLATDTSSSELVGHGIAAATGPIAEWQTFTAPIIYDVDVFPDMATIEIQAGNLELSEIWIDDLHLEGSVDIREQSIGPSLEVGPSPTSGILHVRASEPLAEVLVFDMSGRLLIRTFPNVLTANLQVIALAPGAYIAAVRFLDGAYAVSRFVRE